jgi:membrane-anchored protein YejM (alkaline phosphatase superfamily)
MADTVVHVGEDSPEHVAYTLMRDIARVENKILDASEGQLEKVANRKWILDTYAECLTVVRDPTRQAPARTIVTGVPRAGD